MARSRHRWKTGARSETGYVRKANEDRMGWSRAAFGDVFVVSDGMGGYRGGALAADITLRVLQERLLRVEPDAEAARVQTQVRDAFSAANHEVYSHRDPNDPETRAMGATGVAVITHGARAMVGHVGDSRAYLWRRGLGLRHLTRDHSRVQSLQDAGVLTPEQALVHPDASVLDRAIGHRPTVQADVSDWIALQTGDLLMLCSDGLCGYVSDAEVAAILARGEMPGPTTDRLIELALQKGGEDNVTVQLMRYGSPGRLLWQRIARPVAIAAISLVAVVALGLAGWETRGWTQQAFDTARARVAAIGRNDATPVVVDKPIVRAVTVDPVWPAVSQAAASGTVSAASSAKAGHGPATPTSIAASAAVPTRAPMPHAAVAPSKRKGKPKAQAAVPASAPGVAADREAAAPASGANVATGSSTAPAVPAPAASIPGPAASEASEQHSN